MKQQAGIGIILALTTAMCWGALPIAMKQVLEVMAPPTVVFYRFLMASIGLGAILAIKGKLPPMRIFRKPRWLVLLAIATAVCSVTSSCLVLPCNTSAPRLLRSSASYRRWG